MPFFLLSSEKYLGKVELILYGVREIIHEKFMENILHRECVWNNLCFNMSNRTPTDSRPSDGAVLTCRNDRKTVGNLPKRVNLVQAESKSNPFIILVRIYLMRLMLIIKKCVLCWYTLNNILFDNKS